MDDDDLSASELPNGFGLSRETLESVRRTNETAGTRLPSIDVARRWAAREAVGSHAECRRLGGDARIAPPSVTEVAAKFLATQATSVAASVLQAPW